MAAVESQAPGSGLQSRPGPVAEIRRADRALRFERGGIVYTGDGRIGTLRQVVVDERTAEVTAMVVDLDRVNESILLPVSAVLKTGGSAVFLTGTRRQFEEWLPSAPRFDQRRANKADLKTLLNSGPERRRNSRQAVVSVGKDFLETGSN